MTEPRLSIIIPVLNEQDFLVRLLDDIAALRVPLEVIVVDGGSGDDTCGVARRGGARVVQAERGRGVQLRTGAMHASAPFLCFLHADVRVPPPARHLLDSIAQGHERGAWAFRLHIDGAGRAYRAVEWIASSRSSWFALPYGDQGLVIDRALYDEVGGYQAIPIMEDVAIARVLRRIGGITLLPASLTVSPRRWERGGVVRQSIRNGWLLARYLTGTAPSVLARWYAP